MIDEKLSLAPMMDWTDSHYRMMIRGLTKQTVLYTEMIVDDTVVYNPGSKLNFFVGQNIEEHPSVIQLGGHDPEQLSMACEVIQQYHGQYNEINLNCGCPSQRVAKKCFGAKLMYEPELVRKIVYSMGKKVNIPITVKCRIGVDKKDTYSDLVQFIMAAKSGGVQKFVIHARSCILKGLSTKQNREIPPLQYDVVHRLVLDFPDLKFILNGGIQDFQSAKTHLCPNQYVHNYTQKDSNGIDDYSTSLLLPNVHGVMMGRAAYNYPIQLATADSEFYDTSDPCLSRRQILERYMDYCDWVQSDNGYKRIEKQGNIQIVSTGILLNPVRNLMLGVENVKKYRMALNDLYVERVQGIKGVANPNPREIIEGAMSVIDDEMLDYPLGCKISNDTVTIKNSINGENLYEKSSLAEINTNILPLHENIVENNFTSSNISSDVDPSGDEKSIITMILDK